CQRKVRERYVRELDLVQAHEKLRSQVAAQTGSVHPKFTEPERTESAALRALEVLLNAPAPSAVFR
ncbi:MAG: hypothetical protein LC114_13580, partial [Bryobacterales bacterium]|nr:hypothetical protein [Bryobacterales bacterium]